MSTTATRSAAREKVTSQRPLRVAAVSAVALVAGLAVWFFASMIGDDGVNAGAMVGIFVASMGLTFLFPALRTYIAPRLVFGSGNARHQ